MNCKKCESTLNYGAKYCNKCGEKVDESYEADYKETAWGKIDRIKDVYDNLFFKKITGNVFVKYISLAIMLVYIFFTMYGNLTGIRLKDNDTYKIQYNKTLDEYYIVTDKNETTLDMFSPIGTDYIVFTPMKNNEKQNEKKFTVEEYKKEGYSIKNGEYDYVEISALRGEKKADEIKIVVVKN